MEAVTERTEAVASETLPITALPVPPRPLTVPNMWKKAEDDALRDAVRVYGARDWRKISGYVFNRTGHQRTHVQCLQRWKNVLKDGLSKGSSAKTKKERR